MMCETRLTDLLNILVDRMIEEAGNHHGPVIEELLHLGFTPDELVMVLSGEKSEFQKVQDSLAGSMAQKDLIQENQNIGDLKMYLMQVHNNFTFRKPPAK